MIHGLITLLFCLPCIFFYPPLCLLPAGFYIGREFAQAEYRYIENYCGHKRANMPWWAVFTDAAWTTKGILDWFIPFVVSSVSYTVAQFL